MINIVHTVVFMITFFLAGSLNADTTLILTSALYFKGRWQKSFDRNLRFTDCFYVPKIGCQNTDFMTNTAEYPYGHIASLNADVIEIPYTVCSNNRSF